MTDGGRLGGSAARRLGDAKGMVVVHARRREEPRGGDSAAGPVLEVELSYMAN